MFGELPKIIGRDFAVAYFMPVTSFVFALYGIALLFDIEFGVPEFLTHEPLAGVGIGTLLVWLVGIALMAINRNAIRFLEGYGLYNPFHWVKFFRHMQVKKFKRLIESEESQKRRYRELTETLGKVDGISEEAIKLRGELAKVGNVLATMQWLLAHNFPDNDAYVLPTAFGNCIRAFEVYPRVVYGLDPIGAWDRLYPIMPEECRNVVTSTKIPVDFWVNMTLLSGGLTIVSLLMSVYSGIFANLWTVPGFA
ncbi:MAG: hypothetical protein MN733_30285, partial [Nitrososphaera sp.]|nr:hypothetical protein [Nitrososphaera sp.]